MNRFLLLILIVLTFSTSAFASQWCKLEETQCVECQSDARGYIKINGVPVKTPSIANANGYFKVTDIPPDPAPTSIQKIGTVTCGKVGNDINRTYTVVNKSTTEHDEDTALALSPEMYYVLKWMVAQGVINPATAPTALKNAYLARQRLEQ